MLVLGRKVDQAIRIGEIKVTVVRVKNGDVRLGIEAPKEMPVHREEVYQEILAGKTLEAAKVNA